MQKKLKIILKPIDEIYPYPNNARVNNATVKVLVKLIERVGFNVPIVIDREGVIVKGHARHKAAKILKMDRVPCIVSENSKEKNDRDRVVDNKISELSSWDAEKLQFEIESVETDLTEIGLDFKELRVGIEDVDQSDIDEAKARQNYQQGDHPLNGFMAVTCPYCGGSFEYEVKVY
jgi:ParB-like chromosome segregation protein Spo0J